MVIEDTEQPCASSPTRQSVAQTQRQRRRRTKKCAAKDCTPGMKKMFFTFPATIIRNDVNASNVDRFVHFGI